MEGQFFAPAEGQEDDDDATVVRCNGVSDELVNSWENLGDSDDSAVADASAPDPSPGLDFSAAPVPVPDVPVPVLDLAPVLFPALEPDT